MKPTRISRWSIPVVLVLSFTLVVVILASINAVPAFADANAGNARDWKPDVRTIMQFGNDPSLNAATSIRAMEVWVKFHDFFYNGGGVQEILSKSTNETPPSGMEIVLVGGPNGGLATYVAGQDGGGTPDYAYVQYPISGNLQIERWYHVVATHNGPSSELELYVDGVKVPSTGQPTVPAVISDSLRPLSMGNLTVQLGRPLAAQVDEVRVWNTPRTGAQIRANVYRELTGGEAGLVAYYRFNQTTGTDVLDQSTTLKSLTLTNGGSGYTSVPAVTISGGGGAGATAVARMQVDTASISAGGSGYVVGDVLSVNGGSFTTRTTLTVTAVSSAAVTDVDIANPGVYSALPANPVNVTGGSGTGAQFNLGWAVNSLILTNAGSGYTSAPSVSFSGSGGAAATANEANDGILSYSFLPTDPDWVNNGWVTSGAFYGPRNALAFDGTDDHVSASSPVTLTSVGPSTNLTFMAWVKRNANSSTRDIVSLGNSGSQAQAVELRLNSSNQLEYVRNNGVVAASTASIPQGVWTHIGVVQTGSAAQLYINGVPDGSGTSSTSTTNINRTYIGARRYSGNVSQYFTGQIDEVQIWGAALTPAQVRDYMNQTRAGDEASLWAYYRMDYGVPGGDNNTPETLDILYDITRNSYNGTLNNFARTGTTSNWVSSDAFNTWIGSEGTSWVLSGNWSRGAVPTTTDNLGVVNYVGGNAPIVTDTVNFNHLVIGTGASLTVNGSQALNAGGNWINNGTFSAGNSTLIFGGGVTHSLVLPNLTGFDNLIVSSGAVLVETEAADNVDVNGVLTNNGTIRKTQSATTIGGRTFGLTGAAINVDSVGNLSSLTVDRIDANHPNAGVAAMQTGRYWRINRALSGGSTEAQVDVTLPYASANATSKVCRYVSGLGAGFDCGQNSANTFVANTSVTRNNYPTADWSAQGANRDTWTVGTGINSPTGVAVQVVPSSQVGNSGTSAAITATVVDSLGNQVSGVNLTGATLPSTLGPASGLGTTNASGVSLGTWTAGTTLGAGTLNVGNGSITGTAPISLTAGAAYTITVAANPASLAVGGSTSTITATVTDQFNNFVVDGTSVSFSATRGSVGTPRTTTNGRAVTTFTSGTQTGTAIITATTNSRTGTASVTLVPGAPYTVTLAANPTSVTVDGSSTLTATVTDQYGNFVANGTSVAFATDLGSVQSPRTTTNGLATSTVTSTLAGTAHITATAGTTSGSANVNFAPGAPFNITVQASPTILFADGSTSTITATVRDQFNNFVVDATPVNFSAILGTVNTPRTTTNGRAVTTFTSGVVTGTAVVTATANSRSGSVNLALLLGMVDLSTSTKSASAQIINPGKALTYTIVLSNTGNTLGTSLTLTDAIPVHTTYVPNSLIGAGAAYSATLNQIEWSGSIPVNGSVTVSYTVTVDQAAHDSIVNTANVYILGVLDRTLTTSTTVRQLLHLPLIVRSP